VNPRLKTALFTGAAATTAGFVLVNVLVVILVQTKAIKFKHNLPTGSAGWRTALLGGTLLVLWAVGIVVARLLVRRREGRQLRFVVLFPVGLAIAVAANLGSIGLILFFIGWVLAVRYLPREPGGPPGAEPSPPAGRPAKPGASTG
jgi:hypothetical protein